MTYYRRFANYRATQNNTIKAVQSFYTEEQLSDLSITDRIKKLLNQDGTTEWEKNFLTSINNYFANKKHLTGSQYNIFNRIEEKFSTENIQKRKEFEDTLTDENLQDMKIVANVYSENNSRYHQALVKRILEEEKFVPTEQQWKSFMENDFARGYLKNAKDEPKFKIGDTVTTSSLGRQMHEGWKSAIIIDNVGHTPKTHAVGGKRYTILPYGEMKTIIVEERVMKKSR